MIIKATADKLAQLSSLDETLVEYTRLGSETAFGILVGRHGDAVYTIVRNMCDAYSEADELTLETFIAACREIRSVGRLTGSFRTRLCGIAVRTALARRRLRSFPTSSKELAPTRDDDSLRRMPIDGDWRDLTDPALEDGSLAILLRETLERMDDDVRAAFVLCDLVELPAEETACILETSAGNIRHRVHRARLMLIRVLDRFFGVSQA